MIHNGFGETSGDEAIEPGTTMRAHGDHVSFYGVTEFQYAFFQFKVVVYIYSIIFEIVAFGEAG